MSTEIDNLFFILGVVFPTKINNIISFCWSYSFLYIGGSHARLSCLLWYNCLVGSNRIRRSCAPFNFLSILSFFIVRSSFDSLNRDHLKWLSGLYCGWECSFRSWRSFSKFLCDCLHSLFDPIVGDFLTWLALLNLCSVLLIGSITLLDWSLSCCLLLPVLREHFVMKMIALLKLLGSQLAE